MKTITRSGASPTQEEIRAGDIVAATFKNRKFGVYPMTVNGIDVVYDAFKGLAIVTSGIEYFYPGFAVPECNCRTLKVVVINDIRNLNSTSPPSVINSAKLVVFLDDGTLLAETPLSFANSPLKINGNLARSAYLTQYPAGMSPLILSQSLNYMPEWTINGTIELVAPVTTLGLDGAQEWDGVTTTPAGQLVFDVPEDLCLPTNGVEPGYTEAVERYRPYIKACSDSTIVGLDAGELADKISYAAKIFHPLSNFLSVPPATITVDEEIVENIVESTSTQFKIKRTVSITYPLPADESGQPQGDYSKTLSGYSTVKTELHTSFSATGASQAYAVSYVGEFEDFPAIDELARASLATSSIFSAPCPTDYQPFNSPNVAIYNTYLGGAIQLRRESFPFYDLTQTPFGVILNGQVTGMAFDGVVDNFYQEINEDILGEEFVPQLPLVDTDAVIRSIPSFISSATEHSLRTDYRIETSLTDKETITVFPLQFTSEMLGDLGLYPQEADQEFITGIYLTKGYTFEYKYLDGSFTFKSSKAIKDPATGIESERVSLDIQSYFIKGTLAQLLDQLNLATVEELYALAGATNEADFLAVSGVATMQEVIDSVIPASAFPNLIFKSQRRKTGWADVDDLYKNQKNPYDTNDTITGGIKGAFDPNNLTLVGLYDFLNG